MSGKRVLVTGASGFVGSHLVTRLLARGDEVHVVSRPGSALHRLQGVIDEITVHRDDMADRAALATCLNSAEPELIFHLAAETRKTAAPGFETALLTVREAQINLLTLLQATADMRHPPAVLVRAGSIAEYGKAPLPFREDQREEPDTPYGAGKAAGTHYIRMLEGILPFPVVTARLALMYGANQSDEFLIPGLIGACIEGRSTLIRRPDDRRDLLYIDDAVDALILLAERPPPGCSVLNIGTGIATSVREVAEMVVTAVEADPALVTFGEPSGAQGGVELRLATDRARSLIGWAAKVPLQEGIARTVAGMRPVRTIASEERLAC